MASKRSHKPPIPAPDRGTEQFSEFTGRYLVIMRDDGVKEGLHAIKTAAGLSHVCNTSDFEDCDVEMSQADSAEVFVLDKLNIAVVDADPSQAGNIQEAAADESNSAILAVEPERMMYAITLLEPPSAGGFPYEYLKGYRDAVNQLYSTLTGVPSGEELISEEAPVFADNAMFTWGLQATGVSQSRFSGRGIRVAVLDTGIDLAHPDFAGRRISNSSFIAGQVVQDENGHGTHCIGTALGPQSPPSGVRRYGCAFRGEIFVGKVLSNEGSGADRGILAGINWAITNKCRVISMSLGAPVLPGERFSRVYETVAQRALNSDPGTLIIAAAGNSSRLLNGQRREPPNPVGRPANCPSIMAVAALDAHLGIAPFSDGGINPNGGGVDIAGPGVGVFSSVPEPFPPSIQPVEPGRPWPPRYHTISGTSMATPHVAGIAAMWLEARGPGTSAQALAQILISNARRLPLPSRDVGVGLVQAPQ
jgi:subtilisin family serine protease